MYAGSGHGSGPPESSEIIELLRRRARETGKSLKWNRSVLLLTYAVLATTTIVAVSVGSTLLAAIVAVPGLAIIWVFSTVRGERLERQAFEDDVRAYSRLLSHQYQAEEPLPIASIESPLSDRELEVLTRIAGGSSNKAAALALSISNQTVKNHLSHIFEKLDVNDRTSAVIIAVRNGWIMSDGTSRKATTLN